MGLHISSFAVAGFGFWSMYLVIYTVLAHPLAPEAVFCLGQETFLQALRSILAVGVVMGRGGCLRIRSRIVLEAPGAFLAWHHSSSGS